MNFPNIVHSILLRIVHVCFRASRDIHGFPWNRIWFSLRFRDTWWRRQKNSSRAPEILSGFHGVAIDPRHNFTFSTYSVTSLEVLDAMSEVVFLFKRTVRTRKYEIILYIFDCPPIVFDTRVSVGRPICLRWRWVRLHSSTGLDKYAIIVAIRMCNFSFRFLRSPGKMSRKID